jgi:hypothetical protein
MKHYARKEWALEAWNTRTTESQLRAELDRMTAAVATEHSYWDEGGRRCVHCKVFLSYPADEHKNDCPVRDAEAIRAKYGFDKGEK